MQVKVCPKLIVKYRFGLVMVGEKKKKENSVLLRTVTSPVTPSRMSVKKTLGAAVRDPLSRFVRIYPGGIVVANTPFGERFCRRMIPVNDTPRACWRFRHTHPYANIYFGTGESPWRNSFENSKRTRRAV